MSGGPPNGPDPAPRGPVMGEMTRAIGLALSVGLPFAVLISSGALGGNFLDRRFATWPWLSLLGSALGLTASLVNAFRILALQDRKLPASSKGDGAES